MVIDNVEWERGISEWVAVRPQTPNRVTYGGVVVLARATGDA